jgi:hypothetical protein
MLPKKCAAEATAKLLAMRGLSLFLKGYEVPSNEDKSDKEERNGKSKNERQKSCSN